MIQNFLREFKTFNRKYKNSWLSASLNDKAGLFINADDASLTLQNVYKTTLHEFISQKGTNEKQAVLDALRGGVDGITDPYKREKRWRSFKDFAADWAAKSYMSELVRMPMTLGSLVGFGYACVYMDWSCPFVSNRAQTPEKKYRSRMAWLEGRVAFTSNLKSWKTRLLVTKATSAQMEIQKDSGRNALAFEVWASTRSALSNVSDIEGKYDLEISEHLKKAQKRVELQRQLRGEDFLAAA